MNTDFKFDDNSTKNEGRWRLKDPKHFKKYFRRIVWKDVPFKEGVSYVLGINIKTGHLDVQAIRFKKEIMSEELASKWWDENKHILKKNGVGQSTSL